MKIHNYCREITFVIDVLIQKCDHWAEHDLAIVGVSFDQVSDLKLVHSNLFSRFQFNFRRWREAGLFYVYVDVAAT